MLKAESTRASFGVATAIANTRVNFGVLPGWTPITESQAIVDFITISQALVVADQSSISRAARILGVKQSAVSRRIQALEDELGVSLFERQSNGVRPTIAGQRFFERTRSAIHEIDLAVKNATSAGRGAEGMIRIGVLPSLLPGCLRDLLSEFRDAQPGVVFDFFDGPPRKLIARIMERRLDIAFVVSGTPTPGCDAEAFWSAGICVALPDRHPLAGCELIDWELLKDEHFVMGREATAAGFDGHATERIARIDGRLSLAMHDISQELVMQFVALGFGLSLLSDSSTAIPYPGVAFRPLAGEEDRVSYSAVWLPGNDNPALRRFLSLSRSKSAEQRQVSPPRLAD
ncbi:MAG: LysR family transcriptional regulator [Beijerinckiaceae bacterium]